MADEMSLGPDTKKALKRVRKSQKLWQDNRVNLRELDIHTLPPLPDTVQELDIYGTNIESIASLPPNLEVLECGLTPLRELPPLPESLRVLDVLHTELEELPPLPAGLQNLFCGGFEGFTHLPAELPPTLKRLSVTGSPVKVLPPLPPTLVDLYISRTQITVVPELPESLKEFKAIGVQLAEPFATLYDRYKTVWGPATEFTEEASHVKNNMPAFRAAVNAVYAQERARQASGRARGRNLTALSRFAYGPAVAAANNPFRKLPNNLVRRMGTQLSGINAPLAQQLAVQKEAAGRAMFAPGAGANFAAAAPLVNNTLPALEPATGGRRMRKTLKRKGYKARARKSKKRTQRR